MYTIQYRIDEGGNLLCSTKGEEILKACYRNRAIACSNSCALFEEKEGTVFLNCGNEYAHYPLSDTPPVAP